MLHGKPGGSSGQLMFVLAIVLLNEHSSFLYYPFIDMFIFLHPPPPPPVGDYSERTTSS